MGGISRVPRWRVGLTLARRASEGWGWIVLAGMIHVAVSAGTARRFPKTTCLALNSADRSADIDNKNGGAVNNSPESPVPPWCRVTLAAEARRTEVPPFLLPGASEIGCRGGEGGKVCREWRASEKKIDKKS
jgi:hypothetical protein